MDTSFAWDQHFVTDLDAVDEQHHALVDLFNELSQGLFSKRSDREVVLADTYARLLSYTEHHFQEEEALMAQYAVDPRHVESHHSMHQQFVEQVIMLWAQRTTMTDPATTLVGFLTSWLGLHILGIDQSMARQICSIRGGLSPAQAFDQEFIRLARAVYFENDERARIKKDINLALGSAYVEEKSYQDYRAGTTP